MLYMDPACDEAVNLNDIPVVQVRDMHPSYRFPALVNESQFARRLVNACGSDGAHHIASGGIGYHSP
jgi:hypothetical protein